MEGITFETQVGTVCIFLSMNPPSVNIMILFEGKYSNFWLLTPCLVKTFNTDLNIV